MLKKIGYDFIDLPESTAKLKDLVLPVLQSVTNSNYNSSYKGGVHQVTVGSFSGVDRFLGAVLLPDGRVYIVPYNASTAVIYDPVSNTSFTCAAHGVSGGDAFAGAVLLPDGRIYHVPHLGSASVIYNPATNTNSACAAHLAGNYAFMGGVLLPD